MKILSLVLFFSSLHAVAAEKIVGICHLYRYLGEYRVEIYPTERASEDSDQSNRLGAYRTAEAAEQVLQAVEGNEQCLTVVREVEDRTPVLRWRE